MTISADITARFWSRVDRTAGPTECWPYTGTLWPRRYGRFHVGKFCWRSHRFAWTVTNGPIPDGILVCHTCDNPPCCNPAHLFLGTSQDNVDDMMSKDRSRHLRGEERNRRKLSVAEVLDIRRRYDGREPTRKVAAEFGISKTQVSNIGRRTRWTWLEEEKVDV